MRFRLKVFQFITLLLIFSITDIYLGDKTETNISANHCLPQSCYHATLCMNHGCLLFFFVNYSMPIMLGSLSFIYSACLYVYPSCLAQYRAMDK